ncbi:MAG: hypothetical protein IIX02_00155, partial [Clostridia bacterium]|nr:hypothetical protein [Clostridia bacterium]
MPCAAPTQKVVLKKGCQIPSNANRLDGNNKTCYVLTEDVTFLYENGAWVRQSSGENDEPVSMKPTYENEYVLSDLYHTGHAPSAELEKGYLYVDKTTGGTVYGYNASQSFSITFDFSLNLGNNDVSAQGNYTTFSIAMATRGYNGGNAFGWNFYLYRPGNPNKCIEFFVGGAEQGNWEEAGYFEKGQTYRVTLGYKLLDAATGTVQTYISVNGNEYIKEFTFGADYYNNTARFVDSIAFASSTAITKGVLISDPGFKANEDGRYNLTLQDGNKVLAQEKAWKYTLPELNAHEYGDADNVFIGWTTNTSTLETLYPAGYEYELTKDTTLYPVWMFMSLRDGAAVRTLQNQGGLRFLVNVDGAGYQLGVNKNIIIGAGTLIVPTNYLDNNVAFVHETFPEGYFIDVPTGKWISQSGSVWTYAAALVNISPAQYARSMSARGYLKIAYTDGTEGYVYTAYSKDLHARSIYQVATSAFNDNVKPQAVLDYVNSVADITINSAFEIEKTVGSVGNYTLSAVKEDNAYTITFTGNVKAVMLNGTRIVAGYSAEIVVGDAIFVIDGFKLTSNGATLTFTLEGGDTKDYYQSIAESYATSEAYTPLHKAEIDKILEAWGDDFSNAENNAKYAAKLESIKTQTEQHKNVGETKLAAPVIANGLGYSVTWNAVENADYYFVTDDNDYRDGVYVLATEDLVYKPEVVGKHNVTVTAYSYYQDYACSDESAKFATIEVKPVFTYKAMANGLYKFDANQMKTMGLDDGTLNTKNDGTSFRYDKDAKKYFAYYNKETGWSINEAAATDWTSPAEFPAHAARLKAMGNNIILTAENTSASLGENAVWETSRMKYVMDTAWTLGMKVIVCDDVLYAKSKEVSSKSNAAEVINGREALFEKYVTHPAFYGFSLEDEPEKG